MEPTHHSSKAQGTPWERIWRESKSQKSVTGAERDNVSRIEPLSFWTMSSHSWPCDWCTRDQARQHRSRAVGGAHELSSLAEEFLTVHGYKGRVNLFSLRVWPCFGGRPTTSGDVGSTNCTGWLIKIKGHKVGREIVLGGVSGRSGVWIGPKYIACVYDLLREPKNIIL